ncbi:MAG: bifunctional 4-hydroxy-2-oxoglutarate aldolase/2-dehydro-3-deoxy-phosphogluconate aldolase [Suipraeoptans sp.]
MNKALEQIRKIGIVPVVVLEDSADAIPLAKALIDGGLPCAEVTFRTDAAEESIKKMSEAFPDMLIGAGTVLTIDQVDRAVKAGATFIVSPGFNHEIVKYCVENNIPITPGTSRPTDVEAALSYGLDVVKFFPAEASGGLNMIKSMAAPYTNVKFMPTGGISEKNINEYLAFDKIIACGGSWMVKADLVKNKDFAKITELTREAVMTVLGFEIGHLGINCENESEADAAAGTFAGLFGLEKKVGNSSIFAGNMIEAMKSPFKGKNGHLSIKTNSVERAVYFLESQGVEFDMSTAKYKADKLIVVYLKNEIGGFAIHLAQK